MIRKAVIVVVTLLAVAASGVVISRSYGPIADRTECAKNMQRVGASVRRQLGAGSCPPCPASGLSVCNYVYAPLQTPNQPLDDRTVIMFEPKSNHGDGGVFLFADGHASFVGGERYDLLSSSPTNWWEVGPEKE